MKKLILCILTVPVLVIACAPPSVKTKALVPAKSMDAAKLRQVAVLPFDGPGGREFAAEIEGLLAGVYIDDSQYFALTDRTALEKTLSEMKLSMTGLVDPKTAAEVGKMVGAKGIYTGVITSSKTVDSHYTEKRGKCVHKLIKYDKSGKAREECLKWADERSVSCTKRNATFSFIPKLVEVETGRVVYANNITGTADSSVCQDSEKPLATEQELIQRAKEIAKAALRKDVAPSFITFEINLMDSTEGIKSKKAQKKFESALEFAKGNRMDRACELWGEIRILAPNSPSVLYNLGACSEVAGDLEDALDLYKKADRLLMSPDDRMTSALGRVTKAIEDQKKLREQK